MGLRVCYLGFQICIGFEMQVDGLGLTMWGWVLWFEVVLGEVT